MKYIENKYAINNFFEAVLITARIYEASILASLCIAALGTALHDKNVAYIVFCPVLIKFMYTKLLIGTNMASNYECHVSSEIESPCSPLNYRNIFQFILTIFAETFV